MYSTIYVNFVIEIKLLLNVKNIKKKIKNAKNKIIKFYNQLFLNSNFKNVTKKKFKKFKTRYRNSHDIDKKKWKII